MRQVLVSVFVLLAGCDVTSRGFSEIEYLQEIDTLLQENDRCEARRYVLSKPIVLFRNDELSRELRDFAWRERERCTPLYASYSNNIKTDQPRAAMNSSRNSGVAGNNTEPSDASTSPQTSGTGSDEDDEIDTSSSGDISVGRGAGRGNGNGFGRGGGRGNGNGNGGGRGAGRSP